jgi:hypothetical protein
VGRKGNLLVEEEILIRSRTDHRKRRQLEECWNLSKERRDKLNKDDHSYLGEEKSQLDGGGTEETNQENRMDQKKRRYSWKKVGIYKKKRAA